MKKLIQLIIADLWRNRISFLCNCLLITGVVVPMLVLIGAKSGVYQNLLNQLLDDPNILRIDTMGNTSLDQDQLLEVQSWENVSFAVLRPRAFSDLLRVRNPKNKKIDDAVAFTSGAGDPYLNSRLDFTPEMVVITHDLSKRLDLRMGSNVELISSVPNRPKQLKVELKVAQILDEDSLSGGAILLLAQTVDLFEAFIDQYALPEYGITEGKPLQNRQLTYERMRVHASDLEQVAIVQSQIEEVLNLRSMTDTTRIQSTISLGKNLNVALRFLVIISALGMLAALLFNFWVEVQRKRMTFSILSLLGLPKLHLYLYPIIHAVILTTVSAVISFATFFVTKIVAEAIFAPALDGAPLIAMSFTQGLVILISLYALVVVSSVFSAYQCQNVDPALVLRCGE